MSKFQIVDDAAQYLLWIVVCAEYQAGCQWRNEKGKPVDSLKIGLIKVLDI